MPDYAREFRHAATAIEHHPKLHLLHFEMGKPATTAAIRNFEKTTDIKLEKTLLEFYKTADGLILVCGR